jgi:hypothetical protein
LHASNLPDVPQQRVKELFKDRVATRQEIRESINQEKEYLSKLSGSGVVKVPGQTVEVREDVFDKNVKAFEGFFLNEDVDGIPRHQSFKEACQRTMGGDPWTPAGDILREMCAYSSRPAEGQHLRETLQTSDLGNVLGTSINNVLIKKYNEDPMNVWTEIASDITSISSFQSQVRSMFGGYADLSTVAEQGTYPALDAPGDDENTFSITKYGGTENITMEMVANDQVGFIRRIPEGMARSAIRTLYKTVFDVLRLNTATAYDGTELIHGSHANSGGTALSTETLRAAELAMRSQTAYGESAWVLGGVNKPVLLLVPNELKGLAHLISTSTVNTQAEGLTTGSQTLTTPNQYNGIKYIVLDYWTDADDWCAVADKAQMPLLEVGFFNGMRTPELFVQDSNMIAATGVWGSDKISYKVRHIFGTCILDYRGFYKAIV